MGVLSLRLRLGVALAYVLVLAILALLVPLAVSVRDRVDAEVRSQALSQAEIVAASAVGIRRVEPLVASAARSVRGRVVVVDRRGRLLADSAGQDRLGADYATRPEIRTALAGRTVQETRRSDTLDQRLLATAVPILRAGNVEGAVRVTQEIEAVDNALSDATLGLALIGGVVLAIGLGAGALIAEATARPLGRLAATARRIAGGDLEARAVVEGSREQRELAGAFNHMTERIERMLDSQRDFVADASHQLRTPLTSLRLRVEETRNRLPAGTAREDLDDALSEIDRLAFVIGELLVLSEAGEHDGRVEELSLDDAVGRAEERWRAAAAQRGSRLQVTLDGARRVRCATADLDRILDALIENALAYGPDGQRVAVTAMHGTVQIDDEGPGLAPGETETVFERFHRGSAGRDPVPGTGLGLAIARALARRWDGDVTLANLPGGGARAVVRLPVAEP